MELHNSDDNSLGLVAKVMAISDSDNTIPAQAAFPQSNAPQFSHCRTCSLAVSKTPRLFSCAVMLKRDITAYSSLLLCERQSRYLHVRCAPPEICVMPEDCRPPPARHPAGVTFTAPPAFFPPSVTVALRGPATYASDTLTTTAPLHICFAVSILEINELVLEMCM